MVRKQGLRVDRGDKFNLKNMKQIKFASALSAMLIIGSTLFLSACEQPVYPLDKQQAFKPSKYISYLQEGQQANGVLVKFTSTTGSASRSRSLAAAGLTEPTGEFRLVPGLSLTNVKSGTTINETLATLSSDPNVAYAEPDYILTASVTPNDPRFAEQWGLNNSGNNDINAPQAWDITTGNSSVIIAVIDSGVDYNHPDLQNQIWTNTGEIPNNNRDDDGNGFIDDVRGWDFGAGDNDPMDENDHGTHVAGIIGANSNNNNGVAGINWNVQIMPLKFMNAQGQGSTSAAIRALDYAVTNGARVSNNSWGGGAFSQALFDAIQTANRQNHLFVAAAGNDGVNTDGGTNFPSTYDLPNIISVAATDQSDRLASFSNFGRRTVDLAAPGAQIMSTIRNRGYRALSGTSMAAPFVSGVAGLILAQNANLNVTQIKAAILDYVDPVQALSGQVLTGGRLNAFNSVNGTPSTANPVTEVIITPPSITNLTIGDTLRLSAKGGDGNYTWRSSNVGVATISNTGRLSAINTGTTQITAVDGLGITSSSAISITVSATAANNLTLSPATLTQIGLNETIQLSVSGGTAPYSWLSSNNGVATIIPGTTSTQIASINPNSSGTFRITVSDALGSITRTNNITVSVTPLGIGASQTSINIAETQQLTVSGGTSPYTWISSSPAIISVDQGGLIEGLAEGASTISVSDNNGARTSVIIQVINTAAGSLVLTPGVNIYGLNSKAAIKAIGGGTKITWSSSDPSVATVDSKGIAVAKSAGIAEIRASDETGKVGATTFEVRIISITGSIFTIGAGDSLQLSADGGVGPYTWSTSNTSLASIDSNGLLTSKPSAFGGILVTATDADNIEKSIIVTINDATSLRAPRSL